MIDLAEDVKKKWPYKILHEDVHGPLVSDLHTYARTAGVTVKLIDQPLAMYCSKEEVQWVKNYNENLHSGSGGLLLTGKSQKISVTSRMMAMAAAYLRNYIDARVISLSRIIPLQNEDSFETPNPTILLIPNFYSTGGTGGHTLTNWQINLLHSILLDRFTDRRMTILYAQSVQSMKAFYGPDLTDFLKDNWEVLNLGSINGNNSEAA